MRIAISGASGLIGTALSRDLASGGHDVVRLVRRRAQSSGEIEWDPQVAAGGMQAAALSGVDAVVHLSGAPIAGGRWTQARKAVLRASRIRSTKVLVSAMMAADPVPGIMLCGSAIGWYGDTGDQEVDESAPRGRGFLADLVRDWEAAAEPARSAGIRVASLRSGVVLAADGGMLGRLLLPFRLGLGARIGSGTQYLSWISLVDHVRAIRFALDSPAIDGPVNLTAPHPVTNAEFTTALARALGRPAILRVPAGLLSAALGEVAGELLASARVMPRKLLDAGFSFRHPDVAAALAAVLAPGAIEGHARVADG
ncbi:MAG TPA: TIGR01777 family oxidoreductase [Streptosporangiaceae bacterium]|nr:TIGR01777 family oxidoreductase [Streptosporangiaceae bacterium]